MYLHHCPSCEQHDHVHCWRTQPSHPPGSYGGSKCTCPCKGDPDFEKKQSGSKPLDFPPLTMKIPCIVRHEDPLRLQRLHPIRQPIMEFKDDTISASEIRHLEWQQRCEMAREKESLNRPDQPAPATAHPPAAPNTLDT